MPEELPLEPDLIKVLAADTRREILGLLQDRRMTVTELARELDLGKATIHEHLNKLTDAGLVQRDEDDRLWVYYDLTGRGKRLLNPQRTRFYLALAAAVLAGLVGALVLGLFFAQGPATAPAQEDGGLQVAVADDQVVGEDGVRLAGLVNGSSGGPVEAYLVTEQDLEQLDAAGPTPPGIRLTVEGSPETFQSTSVAGSADAEAEDDGTRAQRIDADGPTTFVTSDSVPPGTYYLYVRANESQDNRGSLPRIQVASLDADLSHRAWWRGVSEDLEVTVQSTPDRPGTTLEGEVVLTPVDRLRPRLVQPLQGSTATFAASNLDDLEPGTYALRFDPAGTEAPTRVAEVHLADPSIVVTPQRGLAGTPTTVTVSVSGDAQPLDADVDVLGAPWREVSSVTGRETVEIQPREPGEVTVQVGRLFQGSVQLVDSLSASITVEDGPQWRVSLHHPNGTPAEGTAVRLDGDGLGFTNATGELVIDELPEGRHRLVLQTPSGTSVDQVIRVDGWDVEPIEPRAQLSPGDTHLSGDRVSVEVLVNVTEPGRLSGTLTSQVGDRPVDARELDLDTGRASINVTSDRDPTTEGRFSAQLDRLDRSPVTVANETSLDEDDDTSGGGGGGGSGSTDDTTDEMTAADTTEAGSESRLVVDLGTVAADADGDGVPDSEDDCPDQAGTDANLGCPRADSDGDAVEDFEDACPTEAGPASNDGCPEDTIQPSPAEGDAAEDAQTETPGPTAAVVLVLAALTAWVARRRV